MRLVIQRVKRSQVTVDKKAVAAIGPGLLVLIGVEEEDNSEDVQWLAAKLCGLRIFPDAEGKMNLDILQTKGEILVVSQFTLHASTKKGNRPSFIRAARPEKARSLYENFISETAKICGKACQTGQFGADMQVELLNDGPVTITIDSKNRE